MQWVPCFCGGKVYKKTVDSVTNLQKLFLFRKTTTKKFRPQLCLIPGVTQIPQENVDERLRANSLPSKSEPTTSDDDSKNNDDINVKYSEGSSKDLHKEIFKLQSVILNLNRKVVYTRRKIESIEERFRVKVMATYFIIFVRE